MCLAHRRVPDAWKRVVTLIAKTTSSDDVDDWLPISLLLSSYTIFMTSIQRQIVDKDSHRDRRGYFLEIGCFLEMGYLLEMGYKNWFLH